LGTNLGNDFVNILPEFVTLRSVFIKAIDFLREKRRILL